MNNTVEVGDLFRDNNHDLISKVIAIDESKFHKYKLISENSRIFWESEQALMSQRYTYVGHDDGEE